MSLAHDPTIQPQAARTTLAGRRRGRGIVRALRAAAAPGLMLGVLGLIFRRLIAGRVLAGGDLHLYFYPYWMEVARALQSGQLPLWNPYLFAGAPLLANSQVGVFYPLNWPFWLLLSASPEPMARAIHWSVLLHVALAALNLYVVMCRRHLGRWPAALAGLVYAGSGFVGVHTEHLNQLQALSWLPLLFLPEWEWHTPPALHRLADRLSLPHPVSMGAMVMILLAGHTQMAFIAAIGLGTWYLARWVLSRIDRPADSVTVWWRSLLARLLSLTPFALAVAIAAVQLLPTLELARYSGRSGGLNWRDAVSFSLPPWDIPEALLPPYLVSPLLPEGVGTVGLLALGVMVLGVWRVLVSRSREGYGWLALSAVGLLGALGGYNPLYLLAVRLGIPGFIHFRAPARFLALYVLAGAALVAFACDWLAGQVRRSPAGGGRLLLSLVAVALPVGIAAELCLSAEYLPHANATIVRAYIDLRPAMADLVASTHTGSDASDTQGGAETAEEMPGRFLSMSQALFEVGDKAEIEIAYGDGLSSDALWAYLVSSKYREILAPNLSLVYQVPAVDGYDGGLLPMEHYIAFTQLLLPGGTTDGRLRENLTAIPDQRWLDLMDVSYLLTDKLTDAWIDDVLYDRQFQPLLEGSDALEVAWLPQSFAADTLSLLYAGSGAVRVELADGRALDFGLPSSSSPEQSYRMTWDGATVVTGVLLHATGSRLQLGAGSLLDSRVGTFYPIVLSDAFRLVHSGDVKIYENVTSGSGARAAESQRAFLVHQTCTADSEDALALMGDPAFDPTQTAILIREGEMDTGDCAVGAVSSTDANEWVRVYGGGEHEVVIDVQATSSGYLVVADAWYPGWRATIRRLDSSVDVRQVEVSQADLLFRAVPIEAGRWRVTLSYGSRGLGMGAIISVVGMICLVLYVRAERRRA